MTHSPPELILVKGAPGIGKSSATKLLAQRFASAVRIEVDDVRKMVVHVNWTNQSEHLNMLRLSASLTNLQMTGDGTRLIISLADGSARVWDIRDPAERRKDLEREWAERVPAGEYLDGLWNTPPETLPTDSIREKIIADASLTPLRRLVAVEMFEERLEDNRVAAEEAFAKLSKDQTEKAQVMAAVEAAELPARVKDQVRSMAAKWEYKAPVASDAQKLAEETKNRKLAEAEAAILEFGNVGKEEGYLERLANAESTFREYLGRCNLRTVKAIRHRSDMSSPQDIILLAEEYLRTPAWSRPPNESVTSLDPPIAGYRVFAESMVSEDEVNASVPALSVLAMIHIRLATADESTLAAAASIESKPESITHRKVLTRDEHREAARQALAKARTLMQSAVDGTPSQWATDADAKALLEEAEALVAK